MFIYTPENFYAEHKIVDNLIRLSKSSASPVNNRVYDPKFDLVQKSAIDMACDKKVSIICGKPGTGKTTVTQSIIESFDNSGLKGVILAPTGAAAKRSSSVVTLNTRINNFPECGTIHKGIGINKLGHAAYNSDNKLDIDYAIMEESTMTGNVLFSKFMEALPDNCRLVISGDPNQLPSVSPGKVMFDMIKSGVIPTTELEKIYRQGAKSGIVRNAEKIIKGESLINKDPVTGERFQDFFFVNRPDTQSIYKSIIKYATEDIPQSRNYDPIKDIQILSPGKKSEIGTSNLNENLRKILNPNADETQKLSVGDKVINRKNVTQLNIVNGDVGYVVEVGKHGATIKFSEGSGASSDGTTEMEREFLDNVYHAYCFTIHSSQGCEFPCVIIPLHTTHSILLFKNLLYTGVTRGKQLVVIVGTAKALSYCTSRSSNDKRITGLTSLLNKKFTG